MTRHTIGSLTPDFDLWPANTEPPTREASTRGADRTVEADTGYLVNLTKKCAVFLCGADCGGELCGWDSDLDKCVMGATTDATELSAGNCPSKPPSSQPAPPSNNDDGSYGGDVDNLPVLPDRDDENAILNALMQEVKARELCNAVVCASKCVGSCGWEDGICAFGAKTDHVEFENQLGDCSKYEGSSDNGDHPDNNNNNNNDNDNNNNNDNNNSNEEDRAGGRKKKVRGSTIAAIIILIATVCVGLFVRHLRKQSGNEAQRRRSDELRLVNLGDGDAARPTPSSFGNIEDPRTQPAPREGGSYCGGGGDGGGGGGVDCCRPLPPDYCEVSGGVDAGDGAAGVCRAGMGPETVC